MRDELERLYERGRKVGLNKTDFAEHLGIAESTVFRWYAGKTKISLQHFRRLEQIVTKAELRHSNRS